MKLRIALFVALGIGTAVGQFGSTTQLNCRLEHRHGATFTTAPQCYTDGWCEDVTTRVICEPMPTLGTPPKPEPMDAGQATSGTTTTQLLIVAAGPVGPTAGRKAELLKPEEIAKLAAAQKKVDEAQKALDDVNSAIKTAHGQTNNYGHMMTSSSFCSPYNETSVEIWGDYALITTERIESSCVTY